jgi:hypothetical protein
MRRMTGQEAATEKLWGRKTLDLIDPLDGQVHRPASTFSTAQVDDPGLSLYALATAALDSGEPHLRAAAVKMAEGYLQRLRAGQKPDSLPGAWASKSLMVTARLLGSEAALEAARWEIEHGLLRSPIFTPNNVFGPRGHMHGNLRSMLGAADYALTMGHPELYSRMDALYRFARSTGTRFGFLPELVDYRASDLIGCETCALMDFAGVGVTLANHGHPEYWGDMERLARNHLVESQVNEVSWLNGADDAPPDTGQFTWRDLGHRVRGAWAGWSSPNHYLAYHETLNHHWGGPELRDKVRALQNCCGGSGVHALFILWKNAAHFAGGELWVNLHLDKLLPQAEIRCDQPYRGRLRVTLREDCTVRVRIPEFTRAAEMQVEVKRLGEVAPAQPVTALGNFLDLGPRRAGDEIVVGYPLPVYTEDIEVGNPGYRQWPYRVTWKGDTVIRVEGLEMEVKSAFSDFDQAERPVFYGPDGPGQLYQRDDMRPDQQPTAAELYADDGDLNLWRIG